MKKLTSRVLSVVVVAGMMISTTGHAAFNLTRKQQVQQKKDTTAQANQVRKQEAATAAYTASVDNNEPQETQEKKRVKLEDTLEESKNLYDRTKDYLGEVSLTKKVLGGTIVAAAGVLAISYAMHGQEGFAAKGFSAAVSGLGKTYTEYAPAWMQSATGYVGTKAGEAAAYVGSSRLNPMNYFRSTPAVPAE